MSQSITWLGAVYPVVDSIDLPKTGGGLATFHDVGGSQTISQNGTYDVTSLEEVVVNVSGGGGTPAISVVDTPDSHGGTVRTITALDISDSTLTTADQLAQGVTAYNKLGVKLTGTGSGGGGATQHTIHLEFSDGTDEDIEVDYDDSWVGSLITSTEPATYGAKTVTLAQLDGVTWYEPQQIPLNTELVDYSSCVSNKAINSQGEAETTEWYYASDYTPVAAGMTFSYTSSLWHYIGFYDSSKAVISTIYVYSDGTPDPDDSNTGHGTLSGNKIPPNAAYVRLCGTWYDSDHISLIRTA